MPRALRLALLWLGTTALAVTVSWFGVRLVLNAAVPDRSKPTQVSDLKSPTHPPPAAGTTQEPLSSAEPDPTSSPLPRQSWTDDNGRTTYQQTVSTDGGWATIRWTSSNITVIDYLAQPGYTARVQRSGATKVEVWFQSSGKSTAINAWWNSRRPGLSVDNRAS
jgi:hypothetical protein